jgi:hypothetical protein
VGPHTHVRIHSMKPVVSPGDAPNQDCVIGRICNEVEVLIQSESASEVSDLDIITLAATHGMADQNNSEHTSYNIDSVATTVPPINIEHESEEEYTEIVVIETCKQLLLKLEAIRLSVLHLQYSMHAGAVGASVPSTTPETSNVCKQLWGWQHAGEFASDVVERLPIPVFEPDQERPQLLQGEAFHIPSDIFAPATLWELQLPTVYDVVNVDPGNSTDGRECAHTTSTSYDEESRV